jgi:zinc-ribbon domain
MSLGSIFSNSFRVVFRYYASVFPIFLVLGVVASLVSTVVVRAEPTPITNISTTSTAQTLADAAIDVRYVTLDVFNYFLVFCLLFFAAGYGIWKFDQRLRTQRAASQPNLQQATGTYNTPSPPVPEPPSKLNYTTLAITTVVSAIIIFAGTILIFIGALILATMLYLSLAACVIEGKSVGASLGRSRQLVSGRWFKTFVSMAGIMILVSVGASFVSILVQLFPLGSAEGIVTNIVWNIVLALAFPLVSASMLLVYYSNLAAKNAEFSYASQGRIIPPPPPPSPYDNMKPQPMYPPNVAGGTSASSASRKFCPSCGAHVTPEERFCHQCGAPQP